MLYLTVIIISAQVFSGAVDEMPVLFAQAAVESVNLHGVITDSVSSEQLPSVRVTIENLGKSFKTTRSSFYVLLSTGTYTFLLQADDYEDLRKSIFLSPQNTTVSFEMVKLSDRMAIKAKQDTIDLYLNAFANTLKNRAFFEAQRLIAAIENQGINPVIVDSLHMVYENTESHWIDSLMQAARVFEDSSKYAEAAYCYQQIVILDSLNTVARDKVDEMNDKLARETDAMKGPTKTASELEKMYNEAVAKFLAEDYNAAYNLFKTFLTYKPSHEGARDYFERTKARLKALE
jgi:hypothetical protein